MSDPIPPVIPPPSPWEAVKLLAASLGLGKVAALASALASYATPVAAWVALSLAVAQHQGCTLPGPVPPVPPQPTPVPPAPIPEPGPTASKVVAVICEETATRTVAQAKVITDPKVRAALKTDGHDLRVIDVSDPAYTASGYRPFAEKVGVPAVLVFDADRAAEKQIPLTSFKLPDAPAALEAGIRKAVRK